MTDEKYYYDMRLRGFSIGTQPKKGLMKCLDTDEIKVLDLEEKDYWSILKYDRKLTEEEVFNYDLDYVR